MKIRKVVYLEKSHADALAEEARRLKKESGTKDKLSFESTVVRNLIETLTSFKK